MHKKDLLIEFMVLVSQMQNIAVDLVEQKDYDDIGIFLDDIFTILGGEEINGINDVATRISPIGYVNREQTMQEIGENQALMIFGEPTRYHNDEEF